MDEKKLENLNFEEKDGEILITYTKGLVAFTNPLYTKEKEAELEAKVKAEVEVEARKAEDKKLTKAIRKYSFPSIGVMIGLAGIGIAVIAGLTAVVCVAITIKAPKIAKDYNDFKRNSGSTKNQVKKYLLSKVKEYFKKPNAEDKAGQYLNTDNSSNKDQETMSVNQVSLNNLNKNENNSRLHSTSKDSGYGSKTSLKRRNSLPANFKNKGTFKEVTHL